MTNIQTMACMLSLSPYSFHRYGERSAPFCVLVVNGGRRGDGEFSRRICDAVERASLEVQSGSSSDEEEGGDVSMSSSSSNNNQSTVCPTQTLPPNPEPKTIPTVSNPNSVYRVSKSKRATSGPQPAPVQPPGGLCLSKKKVNPYTI